MMQPTEDNPGFGENGCVSQRGEIAMGGTDALEKENTSRYPG